jgi:carbon storage regulator
MLVLTRKKGEKILVGENIGVEVLDIGQGKVKIGIVAPNDVRVDRQEIAERRKGEAVAETPATTPNQTRPELILHGRPT